MANKSLFGTLKEQTTTNAAGGSAYAMSATVRTIPESPANRISRNRVIEPAFI